MLKGWWRARSLREQRLLLAAGALLTILLLWLLIVRPLGDRLSRAKERYGIAVQALAEARAQAALIGKLEKSAPPSLNMPLEALISQSAAEAGFSVTRVQPDGPHMVIFTSNSVRPPAFFTWVGQMEARGLAVERLSASTNSDQTLTVQVTFLARSR